MCGRSLALDFHGWCELEHLLTRFGEFGREDNFALIRKADQGMIQRGGRYELEKVISCRNPDVPLG